MEDNREEQTSKGRGYILLKLMKQKEKAEAEAIAQSSTSGNIASAVHSHMQSNVPSSSEISMSSVSSPPVGFGRGNLLNLLKGRKLSETPSSTPSPPSVQIPVPTVSVGRASILSRIKSISSVGQQLQPPSILTPPSDNKGVLGKLSDLVIEDTESTSTLSYQRSPQVPQQKQGTGGRPVQLSANYINLKVSPGKGLFNYEVKFQPDIDSRPLRRKLLNQHLQALGRTKVFDGVTLYLPHKLPQAKTTFLSTHPMDGSDVTLTLIYKKEQSMSENIPFFNVLLGRVMRALSLVRIGQHNFNPKGIQSVPQHKLEVWPGYVTAISEYDGGLKLCIDAKHRVMRTETVRDIMINLGNKPNFKDAVIRELIGLSVFTRYNNKTYRVDDIAWDRNPLFMFEKGDDKISLVDYYKTHWNLQIRDLKQVLLIHRAKNKLPNGGTQEHMILLVPELCYIASLTDSIRSDFRVMKDLHALTGVNPNGRRDLCKHFAREVQNNEIPREILNEWGLSLESNLVDLTGRVIEPETIYFGNNCQFKPSPNKPADWGSASSRNPMLRIQNLNNWCVLHFQRDAGCTRDFIGTFKNVAKVMGMCVRDPQVISLRDDRIETYVQELHKHIQQNVNLMVIIFPTNRTDRYSAVKRVCCVEMPVPSQVIMSRTISRADKLKAITEKIAMQINCKLGGALWALSIPMENCMICGIDVYHAGAGQSTKGSVAGFVASLDKMLTTWHSKICLQGRHQELVDMLQICFLSGLKAYYKHNKRYPDRIIVYRDGTGEGQMDTVANYEVKQMLATFKHIEPSYQPKLTVVVVHKRINTRLFAKCASGLENPLPGTVVDTCITKSHLYDFFLVSQNVRQGTVSPTQYIVIYDSKQMKAEHIQRLTYKLCHLYYNWPGTVKIPAPCQYAHKLCSLVGQNIQLEPHHSLADTLYYL